MKYKVMSLDVWAGEEEGLWEINDSFHVGDIDIHDSFESNEIIELLITENYLARNSVDFLEVEDISDTTISIVRKDDYYPVLELSLAEGF